MYKLFHCIECNSLWNSFKRRILWICSIFIANSCNRGYESRLIKAIWNFFHESLLIMYIGFYLWAVAHVCSRTLVHFPPVCWKAEGQKAALSPWAVLLTSLNQTFINNTKERSCQRRFKSLQRSHTERATSKALRFSLKHAGNAALIICHRPSRTLPARLTRP